jgi:hypothetical protein
VKRLCTSLSPINPRCVVVLDYRQKRITAIWGT